MTGDRTQTMTLSRTEIVELQRLCDWLDTQPCRSATSSDVIRALPDCKHWVSHAWKGKRKEARVIYYQVGYGWRLHRFWQRQLDKLALEVS